MVQYIQHINTGTLETRFSSSGSSDYLSSYSNSFSKTAPNAHPDFATSFSRYQISSTSSSYTWSLDSNTAGFTRNQLGEEIRSTEYSDTSSRVHKTAVGNQGASQIQYSDQHMSTSRQTINNGHAETYLKTQTFRDSYVGTYFDSIYSSSRTQTEERVYFKTTYISSNRGVGGGGKYSYTESYYAWGKTGATYDNTNDYSSTSYETSSSSSTSESIDYGGDTITTYSYTITQNTYSTHSINRVYTKTYTKTITYDRTTNNLTTTLLSQETSTIYSTTLTNTSTSQLGKYASKSSYTESLSGNIGYTNGAGNYPFSSHIISIAEDYEATNERFFIPTTSRSPDGSSGILPHNLNVYISETSKIQTLSIGLVNITFSGCSTSGTTDFPYYINSYTFTLQKTTNTSYTSEQYLKTVGTKTWTNFANISDLPFPKTNETTTFSIANVSVDTSSFGYSKYRLTTTQYTTSGSNYVYTYDYNADFNFGFNTLAKTTLSTALCAFATTINTFKLANNYQNTLIDTMETYVTRTILITVSIRDYNNYQYISLQSANYVNILTISGSDTAGGSYSVLVIESSIQIHREGIGATSTINSYNSLKINRFVAGSISSFMTPRYSAGIKEAGNDQYTGNLYSSIGGAAMTFFPFFSLLRPSNNSFLISFPTTVTTTRGASTWTYSISSNFVSYSLNTGTISSDNTTATFAMTAAGIITDSTYYTVDTNTYSWTTNFQGSVVTTSLNRYAALGNQWVNTAPNAFLLSPGFYERTKSPTSSQGNNETDTELSILAEQLYKNTALQTIEYIKINSAAVIINPYLASTYISCSKWFY